MVIILRAEAKVAGLPRYFTGKPCIHGHVVERITANGTCRLCSNAMAATAHAKKPDKRREAHARWRKANPEKHAEWNRHNKAARRIISKRYNDTRRGELHAYYVEHIDRIKRRIKDWVRDNPETVLAYSRTRRARNAAAEGKHTGAEILRLLEKQGGKCVYCSKAIRKKYHADHIVPLVLGGSNWISNIQLTCPDCNLRKRGMSPATFAARLGRLL